MRIVNKLKRLDNVYMAKDYDQYINYFYNSSNNIDIDTDENSLLFFTDDSCEKDQLILFDYDSKTFLGRIGNIKGNYKEIIPYSFPTEYYSLMKQMLKNIEDKIESLK